MTKTHRMTNTTTYKVWANMIQRCSNPNVKSFADYGGRGIKVCKRWLDFSNFLADMGEQRGAFMLDRIYNDGPYSPKNCRWATRETQNKNSRHNVYIERNGVRKLQSEWADELGIGRCTISMRLKAGWTGEDVFRPASYRKRSWWAKRA